MKKIGFISSSKIPDLTAGDNIYSTQVYEGVTSIFGSGCVDKVTIVRHDFTSAIDVLYRLPILFFATFLPLMWCRNITIRNICSVFVAMKSNDILVVDHFRCAWVVPLVSLFKPLKKTSCLYISHNIESQIAYIASSNGNKFLISLAHRFEYLKLLFWELIVYRLIQSASHITDSDAGHSLKLSGKRFSITLTPYTTLSSQSYAADDPQRVYDLLILGSFFWSIKRSNLVKFLDQLSVSARQNRLTVLVAGRAPESFKIDISRNYEFVTFLGEFNSLEDISRFGRIGLCIDDIGGGFKLKVLDYLCMGLPIAGLSAALEGVPSAPGVKRFDDATELIEWVVNTRGNSLVLENMASGNVNLLNTYFSKNAFIQQLRALMT